MRSILVLNAKGGCGKTTLATNLASFYAVQGQKVTLADLDPQCSSLEWLAACPEASPFITGLAAAEGTFRSDPDNDCLVMDAPAAVHGRAITDLVRRAQSVIMPVLPSPIDIRAAERGLGIFELAPSLVEPDLQQWKSLTRWLNSKRSLPE